MVTALAVLPPGKSFLCTFDRKLGGPQSRSGQRGEDNLTLQGTRTPDPVTIRCADYAIPAMLHRIHLLIKIDINEIQLGVELDSSGSGL